MKPEASIGTIFDGQPHLVRAKRLARFVLDGVRMIPKPIETAKEINDQKQRIAGEIEKQGGNFASMLRQTLGEKELDKGLILRPKLEDRPYDIAVGAVAEDTPEQHRTVALMDITSREGHKTQLMVKATQPTRAGARGGLGVAERWTEVSVLDPTDPDNMYSSRAYNQAELGDLKEVAVQAMSDVSMACDQGAVEVFERVA